jgi:hypothetical protein
MVVKAKLHGWLVGALADAGYQQRDLARAWRVDDAVVSRFISTGKPDLTPERQMMLAQMLGMTNDQLLRRLYGEVLVPRVIALRPPPVAVAAPVPHREQTTTLTHPDRDAVEAAIRHCVERLQQMLPGATISIHITYDRRER